MDFELYSRESKYNQKAINFMLNFKNKFNFKETVIKIENINLFIRNNLHITLIGNAQSLELYQFLEKKYSDSEIEEIYSKINQIILKLLEKTNFELKKEFHILKKEYEKEIRYSIIQIIETSFLENMWKEIEKNWNFKLSYELPHPHITLYKQKENFGIGLNKKEDLKKYSIKKFRIVL